MIVRAFRGEVECKTGREKRSQDHFSSDILLIYQMMGKTASDKFHAQTLQTPTLLKAA
jgi:hypothetical protein